MSTVLYIKASPRSERSYSLRVADRFLQAYGQKNPADTVDELDIFTADLPPFDGPALRAKYRILHGEPVAPEEQTAWRAVEKIIARFTAADKYILAVPMWNFGIPYRLKQYLDILIQPTYTFSFSPEQGYAGLIINKPALVVYARGGEYPPGSEREVYDFQMTYLNAALAFIGFTRIHSLVVEPTLAGGAETAKHKLQDAFKKAQQLAADF